MFIARGSLYSGRAMWRTVKNFDYDGGGTIDSRELRAGLDHYGVQMSDEEFSSVLAVFDIDGNGTINLYEFMTALRGKMSQAGVKAVTIAAASTFGSSSAVAPTSAIAHPCAGAPPTSAIATLQWPPCRVRSLTITKCRSKEHSLKWTQTILTTWTSMK